MCYLCQDNYLDEGMDNRVTVTIDINHPGAKSLLEYLESLDYVKVNTIEGEGACENKNTFLCRSVEEMDSILDQALLDMKEGKGTEHNEFFDELELELFERKL